MGLGMCLGGWGDSVEHDTQGCLDTTTLDGACMQKSTVIGCHEFEVEILLLFDVGRGLADAVHGEIMLGIQV